MRRSEKELKQLSHKKRVEERKQREAAIEKAEKETQEKEKWRKYYIEKAKPAPLENVFSGVISKSKKIEEHLRSDIKFKNYIEQILKCSNDFYRPVKDWEPQGKSANALLNSLANHLFAKYKMPNFLWTGFQDKSQSYATFIIAIARGESLHKLIKSKPGGVAFPSLTRAMCHLFMQAPANDIVQAIRYAQVMGSGGNKRLWEAIAECLPNITKDEEFIANMIQWFCNQSMLDSNQVKPMHDYIIHTYNEAKRENKEYSLKGRTADSVIRQMQEWHASLNKMKVGKYNNFKPSGFEGVTYDFSRGETIEIWRIKELLTAKELQDEGKRQSHCVFSYAAAIEHGRTSIWILTKEDIVNNWALCTIEVHNQTSRIVQVRGRFNRRPTTKENEILTRWASQKGLTYV